MDHAGRHFAPGYTLDTRYRATGQDSRVKHLVFHYTYENQTSSLHALTRSNVSAHYLIPGPGQQGPDGPWVMQLVDESQRAWHAGSSTWQGRHNINDTSIGIEIVNLGPYPLDAAALTQRVMSNQLSEIHWDDYDETQIEALIALSQDIIARHQIKPWQVLAHADIAPTRKLDPGPAFPWKRLYDAGVGAWPDENTVSRYYQRFSNQPPSMGELQTALADWGYGVTVTGTLNASTQSALSAFQMHFRPADYRGFPDTQTAAILWALREKYLTNN
ncbi:N-acetylmuramoyl-L-alanine amidase [Halomonas halocynthiae]|uniref:N-acetylmuramoyl-L-alanine amidase n=1 Tax=Halomonas halocynthiae TaxID=176290 RepID=UPI00041B0611|nr:N-acetylmuramoyl-L-alanine amidase [Halomonas halocynthiae]